MEIGISILNKAGNGNCSIESNLNPSHSNHKQLKKQTNNLDCHFWRTRPPPRGVNFEHFYVIAQIMPESTDDGVKLKFR